jgi:Flp pilus assembly protein TadG
VKRARGQAGQAVISFALISTVMVGLIALAVDFGFATDIHRNLQAAADAAALAGVEALPNGQPNATDQQNARTAAFIYLRDNLGLTVTTGTASCGGVAIDLSQDIDNCSLQSPWNSYTISIDTHSTVSPSPVVYSQATTLSVRIFDVVTTAMAALIGAKKTTVGAFSSASRDDIRHANVALYTESCVNFGNHTEVVAGTVYGNRCSVLPLTSGQGGFCAEDAASGNAGNIVVGPGGALPPSFNPNQLQATCQSVSGGVVDATQAVVQASSLVPFPPFIAPPGITTCSSTCAPASATTACTNHTVDSSGEVRNNCFAPGAYSTIGVSGGVPISNNLIPGVYYIRGDPTCTGKCPGIVFGGNTMNANFKDVTDRCWAAPNLPGSGSFTRPCPDGFAFNPQTPTDPQCAGSSIGGLSPPLFTVTPAPGGPLAAGVYYVRVTALNSMGESLSSELPVTLAAGNGTITVTITAESGASKYQIYGPSTASSQELANGGTTTAPSTTSLTTVPTATTPFPEFDNSSCAAGFHNLPRNQYENNGVTFVIDGKASVCFNTACSAAGPTPTVLLSPYCSSLKSTSPSTPCPASTSGASLNDGAFVFYSQPAGQGGFYLGGATSQFGLTGTLFTPRHTLNVSASGQFELIPGQAFLFGATLTSGNSSNPLIWWNDAVGGYLASSIRTSQ